MGLIGDVIGLFGGPDTSAEDASSARSIEATRIAEEHTDRRIDAQRSWQQGMSNTAYERNVASMRRSGINPAVALAGGGGGPGASTPSGAMAPGRADVSAQAGAASARAATDRKRLSKEMMGLSADVAVKWLQGKLVKKQVVKTVQDEKTGAAVEASAKATKAHTDAMTTRVNAENVPILQEAGFYEDNPAFGRYRGLLRPANSAMKAGMMALGLGSVAKSFGKGLRKSWSKGPPRRGKGKSWGSNH